MLAGAVRALLDTRPRFQCGITREPSTPLDSPDLKLLCRSRLCFLCWRGAAAALAVDTVQVRASFQCWLSFDQVLKLETNIFF